MTIGKRIRTWRETNGWTIPDLADRIEGVSAQSVGRYERGERLPDSAFLEALVRLGCDPVVLLLGSQAAQSQVQTHSPGVAPDAVEVECLAFSASAGYGALAINETGKKATVRRDVLERLNLRPEFARLVKANGDSMLPTIHHDDPLIIDVSKTARSSPIDNKVYVFTIGDEAYLKRLRREPGRLVMISDNRENFPERVVPAEEPFRIVGRVMWGEREL
ncbi:XRE family transcriptional regulator [Ancylobacter sp. A5.8]|uniref:XRE family transcriptional regulator n=1 Tax=Ancylobacter gelatini TaxID=2919920 RepID=UPI001F4D59B0|nr:XRE family transcriptional regulator [Ancylobacter gelatini]